MMGQQDRTKPLFYYFRLEDQIPETHLLRQIDRLVDLGFVRERLKSYYSSTGRPSIDPEVLLRLLLIGYLYGITSERRLMEEVQMHLAYRWFARLDLDEEVPNHSTFSKNRHGRFRESGLFREIFEEIVGRCLQVGLVKGHQLTVDGTVIAADVGAQSCFEAEEVAQPSYSVGQYLEELAGQNPPAAAEEPTAPAKSSKSRVVSRTDPDACWAKKGRLAVMGYFDNYLIDNASRVILAAEASPARFRQEALAARRMIQQAEKLGLHPASLGADKAYGSGEFLAWLLRKGIAPHIPVIDRRHQTRGYFRHQDFRYDAQEDVYYCPEGQALRYRGKGRGSQVYRYCSTEAQCQDCPQKQRCTAAAYRQLSVNWHEPSREVVRALKGTPDYQRSQRARRQIEALFGELKQQIGLRRVRLRRMWNVAEQFYLAATAQNLKRLVRFLDQQSQPPLHTA